MKKLILLLALAFVMCGCNPLERELEREPLKSNHNYTINGWDISIVEIDSCEYIFSGYRLAHKGNCKFCSERRKKEQEELIRKIKEQ